MKITFLGTSHGLPQADRCCSSLLLEIGEKAYLIDGGAPVGDILIKKGFDFAKIKAIFTSHAHSDHTYGMLQFISLCNWYYKNVNMDIFLTEESVSEAIKNLELATTKRLDEERLRRKIISKGVIYNDDVLKVTAFPTNHMPPYPSYCLVFDAEGKRFIYTGDLQVINADDFPEIAKTEVSDLIVTEAAHFDAEVILEKTVVCPVKRVAVIHIARDIVKQISVIEQANEKTDIEFMVPNDGGVIEL